MTSDQDYDEALRRDFQGLREGDAQHAPDFASLFTRARADAEATPVVAAPERQWARSAKRILMYGAPLAAAAALGLWLRPTDTAEQEFEQAVSAWSHTAAQTASSPTDGLLSVPGTEFLRGMPAVGTDPHAPRRGS